MLSLKISCALSSTHVAKLYFSTLFEDSYEQTGDLLWPMRCEQSLHQEVTPITLGGFKSQCAI